MQRAVIITGVSGDIGSAIAKAFDEEGYIVIGTYFKGTSEIEKLGEELKNPTFFYKYDMTDPSFVEDFAHQLKNLDFSFPLSYLRLFMSPRFVSDRYVTFFISTDFFAYGAHDFPLERYVTFDMKRLEVVKAKTLFRDAVQEEVRGILAEEMERQGFRLGDMDMPQPAIFDDDVVFSFQPYQLGAFTDGISHFKISKDKLRRFIVRERLW